MKSRTHARPRTHTRSALALAIALLPAACGPVGGSGDAGPDAAIPPPPPAVCRTGNAGSTTVGRSFTKATEAWGLSAVRGVRVNTADFDGDGYMDIVVLPGGYNTRSAEGPIGMRAAVLLNRPRPDGGRRFEDFTAQSTFFRTRDGSPGARVANLVGFADVDNDGDVDAYTGVYVQLGMGVPDDPGDRSELLLNDGTGRFTLAPPSAITPGGDTAPQTSGIAWLDYDRDGKLDAFVGYFYDPSARVEVGEQPNLFRGAGDGTFTDVTDAAGLTLSDSMSAFATGGHRRPLYGASACDVNGDGITDLLGAAYGRQWNELFASGGDGRYREIGLVSGVGGDMNADFSMDESYRCYCQLNPGRCPMTTPLPAFNCTPMSTLRGFRPGANDQPWRLNGNTFAISCGDVDNDGDMDLYTATIAHPDTGPASDLSQLLINGGQSGTDVRFTRPGRAETGLAVPNGNPNNDEGGLASAMWDFDHDGRLDIYLGTSDYDSQFGYLFHQEPNGRFREVSQLAGFRHACPTGFSLADFDNDGDLDVIVGTSRARTWCSQRPGTGNEVHLYENITSDTNWTEIRLVGRGVGGASRDAIGARVRVTAGGVTQTREVVTSFGHFGQSHQPAVHFGLGTNCTIDRVEVRWPDATNTVETFTDVRANYRVEIRQGEGAARGTRGAETLSDEVPTPGPAPFRFSRESKIRIDRDGRFFHEEGPVEHEKLARALASWVAFDDATGRYVLRNALDWCFVTVEDAPLAVRSITLDEDGGGFHVSLSDGAVEPLDFSTLRVDADSVPYCDVRGGTLPARFSRSAAYALLERAEPLARSRDEREIDESEGYVLALPSGPVKLRRVPAGEGASRGGNPGTQGPHGGHSAT